MATMACRFCEWNEPPRSTARSTFMAANKKAPGDIKLTAKARQVLKFAQERAQHASDWIDLHNALFGLGGKATELFATESERTAFCRMKEYKQILALMDRLPAPPVKEFGELLASANGAI